MSVPAKKKEEGLFTQGAPYSILNGKQPPQIRGRSQPEKEQDGDEPSV